MMNFNAKFVAIPEIDFSDFGEIMDTSYGDYSTNSIRIIFSIGPTSDMYYRFTDGIIEQNNRLNDLIISNINIELDRTNSFRTMSGHEFGGQTQSYRLDVTLEFGNCYKTKLKLFDRYKKIQGIIAKIKENGTY